MPAPMPTYSHTRLGVYETGPRQYRHQYVAATRLQTLDELLAGYRQRRMAEWRPDIQISRPELTANDYRRQGKAHPARPVVQGTRKIR